MKNLWNMLETIKLKPRKAVTDEPSRSVIPSARTKRVIGEEEAFGIVLIEVILGRVRESVMLSKHTNRQQLVEQSGSPKDSPKENKED